MSETRSFEGMVTATGDLQVRVGGLLHPGPVEVVVRPLTPPYASARLEERKKLAGCLDAETAQEMMMAIEAAFEQVDEDGW